MLAILTFFLVLVIDYFISILLVSSRFGVGRPRHSQRSRFERATIGPTMESYMLETPVN
jgi:hypothetical protein